MERAREYRGKYHVLHGVLSPMNGWGRTTCTSSPSWTGWPRGEVQEVIMATNPDTEGEATAMYLSRLLKPFQVKVTRPGLRHPGGQPSGVRRRRHPPARPGGPGGRCEGRPRFPRKNRTQSLLKRGLGPVSMSAGVLPQNGLHGLAFGQLVYQFVQVAHLPHEGVLHSFYPHAADHAFDLLPVGVGVGAWRKKSP